MITIRANGLQDVIKDFGYLGRELPTAVRNAVNDLAYLIREKEMETVKRVFKDPKPQTVKNFWVRKGTRENPRALIQFDQIFQGEEYMVPEVEGGRRRMKPSERRLKQFYIPGKGARLDKYGNMQGGQITQILSRLGRFGDVAGYDMNETARSRGKRSGGKKSLEYFIVTTPRGGLKPGVYQRTQSGAGFGGQTSRTLPAGSWQKGKTLGRFSSVVRGKAVLPVMVFTKGGAPRYKAIFPFFEVARKTTDENFRRLMDKEVGFALRRLSR